VHRVVALAIADVVAFDLAIPGQVFGHRDERDRYSFAVCAARAGAVPSTTGYDVRADAGLEALDTADTIVVPGFWPLTDPAPEVLDGLRKATRRGARVASVCIGAFALAAAGVLDGRAATTHWEHSDAMAARFPAVRLRPDVLYVDEGQVLTSAGVTAGIDLCLHLYRTDHGAAAAAEVARRMVAPMHRPGGQAQYDRRPLPSTGAGLAPTCAWALEQMARPLTVADLARQAHLSTRTFARQFLAETGMTPLRWLTAQRVLEVRRLLEATDLTVDDIAHRCGFSTPANLRVHLARAVGMTPSAYRATFRGPAGPRAARQAAGGTARRPS
jgi:transcriptional regulator GlxA family with amidase domain